MNLTVTEQLESLDTFQRAEFLRRRHTYETCTGFINSLRREKTFPLHEKMRADQETYDRLKLVFLLLLLIGSVLLLWVPPHVAIEIILLIVVISLHIRSEHRNTARHDSALLNFYVAEIERYQAELQSLGLSDNCEGEDLGGNPEEDAVTRDILTTLGFDSGLIGSELDTWPLKPQLSTLRM